MFRKKNIPLILSLLTITIYPILAYLIFIPFLGFYNDDWLFGYLGHFYGPQELIQGLAGDRPIVGYLFAINHILFGDNLLFWHIYMFSVRLLGGYLLFFLLRKLWPNRLTSVTYITILFLIYPGFLQQIVPLGYQNYITALTIWIASLFFTVLALKSQSKIKIIFFTLAALILQIFSFLLLEFFIGMEMFRFLLITYCLLPNVESWIKFVQLKKRIKYLSPYVICLLIFFLWRVFIFKSARTATNIAWVTQIYYSDPIWILKIPLKILYSFFSTVILAYLVPIIDRFIRIPLENSMLYLSIGIISSLGLHFKIIKKIQENQKLEDSTGNKKWGKGLLLIGVISIFTALIPIIVSGRFVSEFYDLSAFDRYTISSIIGVGFIITGFLIYKASSTLRHWTIILLVTLSITIHLMNSYWHTTLWDRQKNIWWQLYWRTSQIQKNALLIFDSPEVADSIKSSNKSTKQQKNLRPDDYLIWAPGNLFFNYSNSPSDHFTGQYLSNRDTFQKIKDKTIESVAQESSTIKYTKDFNNVIIISLPDKNSCLWVIDREREELPNNPSQLLKSTVSYSDVDKLVQRGDTSIKQPSEIFGHEPVQNWCYYFQKASLSRQLKNWGELNKLTEEVLQKNIKPKDVNEWLPFIEGLLTNKKYLQAEKLIKTEEEKSKIFKYNLCKMVYRLKVEEFRKYCI